MKQKKVLFHIVDVNFVHGIYVKTNKVLEHVIMEGTNIYIHGLFIKTPILPILSCLNNSKGDKSIKKNGKKVDQ